MATVTDRKPIHGNFNDPGAVFNEADSLLERARDAQREQAATVGISPVESQYNAALAAQIEAKHDQAEGIEDRLEHLVEQQASRLQQAQSRRPGLLALPGARARWQDSIQQQQASMLRLQNRLELVREIRDGMGLHGPRVEELATRKLRAQDPELADGWDELREAQRLHRQHQRRFEKEQKSALEREQHQAQGAGRSLSLTQLG